LTTMCWAGSISPRRRRGGSDPQEDGRERRFGSELFQGYVLSSGSSFAAPRVADGFAAVMSPRGRPNRHPLAAIKEVLRGGGRYGIVEPQNYMLTG